jgi:hypothetical protein
VRLGCFPLVALIRIFVPTTSGHFALVASAFLLQRLETQADAPSA